MLGHILSAKVVILCVEPYLALKNSTFFFRDGAALYPKTSGPTQNRLGDRGTPSIVTGSTYGQNTGMWQKFGFLGRSKSMIPLALSRRFEPLRVPFFDVCLSYFFLHAEHR